MRSEVIIIVDVRFQNSAQAHLAQDNDVVYTLMQSARDDAAIDPVAIADEVELRAALISTA
jgi:hypothetical protein